MEIFIAQRCVARSLNNSIAPGIGDGLPLLIVVQPLQRLLKIIAAPIFRDIHAAFNIKATERAYPVRHFADEVTTDILYN